MWLPVASSGFQWLWMEAHDLLFSQYNRDQWFQGKRAVGTRLLESTGGRGCATIDLVKATARKPKCLNAWAWLRSACNVSQTFARTFARTFGDGWVKVEPIVSATFEQPRTPQNYARRLLLTFANVGGAQLVSTRNCLQMLANVLQQFAKSGTQPWYN